MKLIQSIGGATIPLPNNAYGQNRSWTTVLRAAWGSGAVLGHGARQDMTQDQGDELYSPITCILSHAPLNATHDVLVKTSRPVYRVRWSCVRGGGEALIDCRRSDIITVLGSGVVIEACYEVSDMALNYSPLVIMAAAAPGAIPHEHPVYSEYCTLEPGTQTIPDPGKGVAWLIVPEHASHFELEAYPPADANTSIRFFALDGEPTTDPIYEAAHQPGRQYRLTGATTAIGLRNESINTVNYVFIWSINL